MIIDICYACLSVRLCFVRERERRDLCLGSRRRHRHHWIRIKSNRLLLSNGVSQHHASYQMNDRSIAVHSMH
jgi:hypothetical protein